MKNILFFAALCTAMVLSAGAAEKYRPTDRPAQELRIRDGLPNFYKKLYDGKNVTIAYFGGSITAQPGWRVQSEAYLKKRFPKSKITSVNAAIGGTGSMLGTFRVQRDVISKSPDLVFVEFAVNDSGQPPPDILRSMEGIVRQIWKADPSADICFVYTFTARQLEALKGGKMFASEQTMDDLADHYAIPSVNMCLEIAKLENDGKLVMAAPGGVMTAVAGDSLNSEAQMTKTADGKIIFSKDGTHPYPNTGHVFYTRALVNSLEQMEKLPFTARSMPAPLVADNLENAKLIAANNPALKYSGPAEKAAPKSPAVKGFGNRADSIMILKPGAELTFKFKGTLAQLYDIVGPHGAVVEVDIDGKTHKAVRIDGYCTWSRLASFSLGSNLPDSVHTVKIRVLADKVDKRAALFEKNREYFDSHKADFDPCELWIAGVMLAGDIIK